jgi:hypothetical protein
LTQLILPLKMPEKKSFLLGADPEFILLKEGNPFSAEGVIGHGKFNPLDMGNDVVVHEDNILVEFNIKPASNKIEFLKNNLKAVYQIYHQFLKASDLMISKDCYAEFDEKYLYTEQAQSVGCSPEFDAMTCDMMDPPQLSITKARTAGGHVHIGYENENNFDSMMIVKMLDLYLAIPSLILDKDKKRRAIYGKASSYRRTEGVKVEYRTLSNFWLFEKTLLEWVYNVVDKVVNDVLNGVIIDDDTYLRVREVINSNNDEEALKIIAEHSDMILPVGGTVDLLEMVYKDDAYTQEFIGDFSEDVELVPEEKLSEFEKSEQRSSSASAKRRKQSGEFLGDFAIEEANPGMVVKDPFEGYKNYINKKGVNSLESGLKFIPVVEYVHPPVKKADFFDKVSGDEDYFISDNDMDKPF